MFWFFNYQFAPFSLAMGLLLILFMIETRPKKTAGLALLTLILCVGITLLHPFAIVFFIAYAFVMYLLGRNKYYRNLSAISLVMWLLVTIFSPGIFFSQILQAIVNVTTQEYASSLQATLSNPFVRLPDTYFIAQTISRVLVVFTALAAGLGFLFFLRTKKLRHIDFALLISAGFYSLVGAVLSVMGQRAWFILFMPLSLGVIYFLEHRFGKYLKFIFIVLLVFFAFLPLSGSFNTTQVFFQTKNEDMCTNFALSHYNWNGAGSVLAHFRLITYIESKTASAVRFESDFQFTTNYWNLFPNNVPYSNCIVYTSGLAQSAYAHNYSIADLWWKQEFNRAYDSGSSYILIDSDPLQS